MQSTRRIRCLFYLGMAFTLATLVVEYVLLAQFLQTQTYATQMIDMAGGQRLLSQRIALMSHQLVDAPGASERQQLREDLQHSVRTLRTLQAELINPLTPVGHITLHHEALRHMYFEPPMQINAHIETLAVHAETLAATPTSLLNDDNPDLTATAEESAVILNGFDAAMNSYQAANSHDLRFLNHISVGIFSGILLLLAVMWRFIFRPILHRFEHAISMSDLQQCIATTANEATDLTRGLAAGIHAICRHTGWQVGHVYLYDSDKSRLVNLDAWYLAWPSRYLAFKRLSERFEFNIDEGFIGQVLSQRCAVTLPDITRAAHFTRQEVARLAGLKQAHAFPIFVGQEVVGVMEFYSDQTPAPDPKLMQAMAHIGKQLGQVIERERFKERATLLETAINSANDGVIISRARAESGSSEIIYVNDAFARISGHQPENVLGHTPRILQSAMADSSHIDHIRAQLLQGRSYRGEVQNFRPDGAPYWLDLSVVPVLNAAGRVTHYAAIERDITDRKEAEIERQKTLQQLQAANAKAEAAARELQASLRQAQEASKSKSDFLANMSHELRTPMNGVLGMAQLLADTELNPEQKQLVATINGSGENLLMLLNDILDFSKIEAGVLELEHIAYPVRTTIDQTIQLLAPQALAKDLDLQVDYGEGLPEYLWGDSGRLRQIFTNLIGNALKFTEQGHVLLRLRMNGDEQNPRLHCSVEDTGIGIPPEKLEQIFEKFSQGDVSVTRKYGGTGLGLAITRHLVALMGGKIGVESAVGKGSTFWFTLPCEIAQDYDVLVPREATPASSPPANRMPISEAKVLLVEDFPVNQVFAEKLLRKFGVQHIDLAENGIEAVLACQSLPYDIVFMDCQMPKLDGYLATSEIRIMESETGAHVPIVAMTANAMIGDREKCLNAGMDDYISKPLRVHHLRKSLEHWFLLDEVPATQPIPTGTASSDDIPVNLDQLRLFTDGDPAEEKALADLFLSQADEMLTILRGNLSNSQAEAWKSAAHRFKGSSGNMGAMKLHQLCKRAESHADDDVQQKLEMLSAITSETERIRQFFTKH